jgi:hypothetical protein
MVSMADEIYRKGKGRPWVHILWQKKSEDRSRKSEKSDITFWKELFCDDE